MNLDRLVYPKDIEGNLRFRMELHDWLSKDVGAQAEFIALLKENPVLYFDTVAWTYNPDLPIGQMNVPFIVSARPAQVKAVNELMDAIIDRHDVGINKGRKEGATELLMKFVSFMFSFFPDTSFLIGSRSEELVDKTGDPGTLFAKIDYALAHYPMWLTKRLHVERNFKHIKNLDINATIDGEATNENFGAGKRVTMLILDEFGRVQPRLAQSIADTVRPISECIVYNSTHWYGPNHAFNQVLQRKGIAKVNLFWWDNPEENKGMYFDDESKEWPLPNRSPWFNKAVERSASRRDVLMNLFGDPSGSSEQFFDAVTIAKIRTECVLPKHQGKLIFDEKIKEIEFNQNTGSKELTLFVDLVKDKKGILRLNQEHNFIVGCDIGFGAGASNSTAEIVDVNTGENVGELICSNKTPEEFADAVVALCKWIGGVSRAAYLIFENNGGQGGLFSKRVISRGLTLVYTKTTEQKKVRKRLNEFGWHSNRNDKEYVLGLLNAALKEGMKESKTQKFIKIYNESVADELGSYIFYDTGEVDSSEDIELNTGARARHGDRVIGLALCILAMQDQPKSEKFLETNPPVGSLAYRMLQDKMEKDKVRDGGWNEPIRRIKTNWQF